MGLAVEIRGQASGDPCLTQREAVTGRVGLRNRPPSPNKFERFAHTATFDARVTRVTEAPHAQVSVEQKRRFTGHRTMYNLTVAGLHTYCVLAGNKPVLVHNCGDLVGDAATFPGAHVLDEHVNVTPQEAVDLAAAKGGKSSVFIDEQTAQQVVDYGLAGNQRKIQTGCVDQISNFL